MAKLETASILLAIGGDGNNTVPKYDVTAAEIAVLRLLHGEQAVTDVKVVGSVDRTDRQEIARLQNIYSRREGERIINTEVNALYPGVGARVPTKIADLELPEELFAVKEREVAKDDDDTDVVDENGEKPLGKMTLKELQTYASQYPDLDLNGVTRKDDVREAIELHEKTLADGGQDGEKKTDSVFE